jgi:hypothetical protein
MKSLAEWLAWSTELEAIYQEELGRSCWSDPHAFVNWTWHWSQGQSADWVRSEIRKTDEYLARHGGGANPALPPIPTPTPFPARPPSGARLIKVADPSEGPFPPRFYSYWSNAWLDERGSAVVFAGHVDGRARFWRVDLGSGHVTPAAAEVPFAGTTEGWSWNRDGSIHLIDGARLLLVNPFSGHQATVLDISGTHPGCRLWQAHAEGDAYCATVERITSSGPYERIGTVAQWQGQPRFFPAIGRLDESQLTGSWLVIKEERERDGSWRLDNRVINLATGQEAWVLDEAGALGHSDGEGGLLVGEDDQRGKCVAWHLASDARVDLLDTWNMGHVAYRGGRCIVSNETEIREVPVDGRHPVTTLVAHGAEVRDYDSQVRANLDPTGRVACYMANGSIYLLVIE